MENSNFQVEIYFSLWMKIYDYFLSVTFNDKCLILETAQNMSFDSSI